ncbi:MAG: sugar transferase [Salinivirgaceae bacterium]
MTQKNNQLFSDKNRSLSQLFQIAVALWFFRMVLPGMLYLFLPVFIALLGFLLLRHHRAVFHRTAIFEFLKTFNPLVILGLLFIYALLLSGSLYERSLRDLFEYGVNLTFLVIFFNLTYRARKKAGFVYVFNKMTRIIWISAFIVAVLGLIKHALQWGGYSLPVATQFGTTFNQDKNFFALYSMLGIIGLLPRLAKASTFFHRLISQSILGVLILNIIFSYSYRSPLLLALLALLMLVLIVLGLTSQANDFIKQLSRNLRLFTLIYFLAALTFIIGFSRENSGIQKLGNNYIEQVFSVNYNKIDESLLYLTFHFDKWSYALDLFNQRSTAEKLLGDGFDYLSEYGLQFNQDAALTDYPHNPVLSALLYSGVVGAVFILFFILVALYYGGIYFRKYPLYSMMLYTSMLFILFSGNSLFSVPIFLFLFSLSFMIRHQEISELHLIMNLQKPGAKFIKETFDYILASLALVFLSPLLLFISLVVGFTMGWPVVYTQVRIGQNGKPFKLHKFRSMKKVKSETTVAAREQNRITRFGRMMRKYKLDELPELWNIIRGDMSFVGPRPDVPGYADKLLGDDRVILQLKPGLTGAASLKYMHEEEILAKQQDPQEYNDKVIFPDKVHVNKKYMEKWTLWLDLKLIALTAIGRALHEDRFL